ncbi:hypothetical protein V1478_002402 [Vespula squamosa]|uniref:Uncharacterized protein n=1 Tax=Vespula squamosa TaxID=30214 RepID=A0ABD2BVR9_VESSQ
MSVSRILTDSQINSLGSPIILRNIFVLIIMVGIGKQIIKETIIFDDRIIALQQACINDLQRMEKL